MVGPISILVGYICLRSDEERFTSADAGSQYRYCKVYFFVDPGPANSYKQGVLMTSRIPTWRWRRNLYIVDPNDISYYWKVIDASQPRRILLSRIHRT